MLCDVFSVRDRKHQGLDLNTTVFCHGDIDKDKVVLGIRTRSVPLLTFSVTFLRLSFRRLGFPRQALLLKPLKSHSPTAGFSPPWKYPSKTGKYRDVTVPILEHPPASLCENVFDRFSVKPYLSMYLVCMYLFNICYLFHLQILRHNNRARFQSQ